MIQVRDVVAKTNLNPLNPGEDINVLVIILISHVQLLYLLQLIIGVIFDIYFLLGPKPWGFRNGFRVSTKSYVNS